MTDKRDLTAPCGIDCFNCEIHEDNLTDQIVQAIQAKWGVPREAISCRGCRQQDGSHFHLPPDGCATLNCVKKKKVEFCCDCEDFPCALLAPLADGADRFPHNIKLFNLCRIKAVGVERWAEEEAGEIRKKYFTAGFAVGKGQSD